MKNLAITNEVARIYKPVLSTHWARPLILNRISAGFPSPAEDYIEGRLDLTKHLIRHPVATFYIRVSGDSMSPKIEPGELLVVDRATETKNNDIVVARIGNDLCVKKLHFDRDGSIWLKSENRKYPAIEITEDMDFEVWGRVMWSIQGF